MAEMFEVRLERPVVEKEPRFWSGDVVVVGGGSAGCSAAIAAARQGASVLLIESGGFLGGTGTRVLDTFYGFYAPGGNGDRVVRGIGAEVCDQLEGAGQAFLRENSYGAGTGVTYEPEALKRQWDRLVGDAGVRVLLYGLVTATILDGQSVCGVVVQTRSGPKLVLAGVTIDATGDGDVAWRAGAELMPSLRLSEVQPATETFRVGGVGPTPATTAEIHRLMAAASASRAYQLPRLEGSIHKTLLPNIRHANMTRVTGKDLTDPWELSAAEREGRAQVAEYVRFLRDVVPGYSESYLIGSSTRIGVRESRRLRGVYTLDRSDFTSCASHTDDIARCGAPIEDHSAGTGTHWEYVGGEPEPNGLTYGIPYRSLVPISVDGLLAAGRFFSATHEAHASARSIAQCMAMGQAAGTAAALAVEHAVEPRFIDVSNLRQKLMSAGANV